MRPILKWALALAFFATACRSAPRAPIVAEPSPPPADALEVTPAPEEVVVAAWAEPKHLPPGGGIVQILIRTKKRGGAPFPAVEVRLATSMGTLYSAGHTLTTDAAGMTRDRLTARKSAEITLNAGGTRYRFTVPVLPASPD